MARGFLISFCLCAAFLMSAWGAQAQTQGSAQPAPAAPKEADKAPAVRRAPAPATRNPPRRTAARRRQAPVRSQQQPARERYGEIQKALAKAGYDPGPTDGVWGTKSVAALQEFQRDQDLEPTGKIDALSLIRLGLGPKYATQPQAQNTVSGPSQ